MTPRRNLRLGQKIYKISLEHRIVPESKEELKNKCKRTPVLIGICQKGHRSQLKELPIAKAGTI